ncbi:LPS export ABC transporter permease LptF [Sedimentitalea sp. CY04]|uniref:LPS export ABC transporter permease LptF n=1 Tax=Parasedimentitalea denitrificans TaxID=2211118 RepID=A0ABX0W548_9RHOB|nr:LPS export ABC transporter permease LptF [Sedimentitalea sp. CY04]
MSRFDRYVLSQYLLFFGFFALILVAVFWINRAVVLFDRLIGDGQSALILFEFTALALPNLVRMVLPVAAFTSAVWVTNRLNSESELTVLRATGTSPWQMAKPALAFGLITALMMSVLTHFLLPASIDQLKKRETEASRNITAKLLSEGNFLHPTKGVTFFIRKIDPDGTLNDVFLSDQRTPDESVLYTGERAFLVRDQNRSHLVMIDGMALRTDRKGRTLSSTTFSDFSYDISTLTSKVVNKARGIRVIPSYELLTQADQIAGQEAFSRGQLAEELHLRFARALVCIAVVLIGFSSLMLGTFSRFGFWRQTLLAFVLLIFVEGLRGVVAEPVIENANLWPLVYLPSFLGLAVAGIFLQLAARPIMLFKKRPHATVRKAAQ